MFKVEQNQLLSNPSYDGDISRLATYVDKNLTGVKAREGKLTIQLHDGTEEIDCVSIDRLSNLPNEFSMDLIPRSRNGGYYLDVILYVDEIEKGDFEQIPGTNGLAKVSFKNDITKAIYNIIRQDQKIQDLTLMPPNNSMEDKKNHLWEKVHKRLTDNRNKQYMYCTSNVNGKSALRVHFPEDPYKVIKVTNGWLNDINKIR